MMPFWWRHHITSPILRHQNFSIFKPPLP